MIKIFGVKVVSEYGAVLDAAMRATAADTCW